MRDEARNTSLKIMPKFKTLQALTIHALRFCFNYIICAKDNTKRTYDKEYFMPCAVKRRTVYANYLVLFWYNFLIQLFVQEWHWTFW